MVLTRMKFLPWVMWALPLTFFAYQFVLRLWPSLLMGQIMHQFSINATSFGFLSAIYYLGYAGMQIPLAICLERFGVRAVVSMCALVCGIATFLFSFTSYWSLALLGRFLIGVGSAAGFLGTSKAISLWFPALHYGRLVGLTFSFGLLGAVYGGKPISLMIQNLGWESVACILGIGGVALGMLMLIFFKNPSAHNNVHHEPSMMKFSDLGLVLRSSSLIGLSIANLLMVGALEGFADVWGVNYLMETHRWTQGECAGLISFIFIGMLFGGPILAFLSERLGVYPMIMGCSLGMASLFFLMLVGRDFLGAFSLKIVFFTIGIFCCYQVLIFSAGSKLVTSSLLSITVAFLNCINMLGGSFFHTMVGSLMDTCWEGNILNGVRIYTHEAYFSALMAIPICSLLGGFIIFLLYWKEKKQQSCLKF
jgi:MFS family permease